MAQTRAPILVVEDNAVNQTVLVAMLGRRGYATEVAADGLEALEKLSHGEFAAVLMDCHMPRMNGFEATTEIRRTEVDGRRIPVIAVTASEGRSACMAAGMDDFLPKPVRSASLEAVLERWLEASPGDD